MDEAWAVGSAAMGGCVLFTSGWISGRLQGPFADVEEAEKGGGGGFSSVWWGRGLLEGSSCDGGPGYGRIWQWPDWRTGQCWCGDDTAAATDCDTRSAMGRAAGKAVIRQRARAGVWVKGEGAEGGCAVVPQRSLSRGNDQRDCCRPLAWHPPGLQRRSP